MKKPITRLAFLALVLPLAASTWHALAPITPSQGSPAAITTSNTLVAWVAIQADAANSSGTCNGGYILVEDSTAHVGAKLSAGQSYTAVATGGGDLNLTQFYLDASAGSCVANVTYGQN
jgi:hypothetical protein